MNLLPSDSFTSDLLTAPHSTQPDFTIRGIGTATAQTFWQISPSLNSSSSNSSAVWAIVPSNNTISEDSPPPRSEKAIAFIDRSLEDYQILASGLQPNTEVWLLNPEQNEIDQITQVLSQNHNVSSVSIFSHASDGNLTLGLSNLDLGNLETYTHEISSWATALTDKADILLYGCNLAASEQGQSLVQQLSQLTGADVGASSDLTGSTDLGGNWTLEYWTGQRETVDLLEPWVETAYHHVFANFIVSNKDDSGAGSLRQAILDANGMQGADTISFDSAVFGTTPQIILLTSGAFAAITSDLTINGPGAGLLTINGNNASRVFQVNPNVNAAIVGVTIANGKAINGGGFLSNTAGGGILNFGSLGVINTTFSNNNGGQLGGGIANFGGMLINGGTFNSNQAISGAGIYNAGGIEIRNSNFNTNQASGNGGGVFNSGSLTIDNDYFSRNTAGNDGGSLYNSGSGTASILTSVIVDGRANRLGGGIANFGTLASLDNTLIRGNQSTGSGGAGGGLFNGGTANLTNTSILGNVAAGIGGGIYNGGTLTVRANSLISSNRAADGGGIYNDGTARLGESTVMSNRRTTFTSNGADLRGTFISEGFNTIGYNAGSVGFPANNALSDTIIFPSY
ncbi:MAG: hypothetical protein B0A82_23560 [Alkalinema sp. CACIAM 70d]|nr:MAG: hypothetical protein B0A82_23560 [Alkalinema sp. CACIAM 70d]